MEKEKHYLIAGILFGLSLISFSFASGGVTGFITGGIAPVSFWGFLGIILLAFSILIAQTGTNSRTIIIISRQARERLKRDKRVIERAHEYFNHITQIQKNPNVIPRELIGKFYVSPRGEKSIRIAWYYDRFQDTIIIYDLLYHIGNNEYTDFWISKVRSGKIKPSSYDGFEPLYVELFRR